MMDLSNDTPIACSSCAKAKAKCDKKVPCTRCANKRIHCQPRKARRSGDNSNNHDRQHDASRNYVGTAPENPLQWASMSPFSVGSTFPTQQPPKFHQRKSTNDMPFFDPGNGLVQTPPSSTVSLASIMQPFGEMEGLLEDVNYSPTDDFMDIMDGGNPSLMPTGIQTPVDFGMAMKPSMLNSNEFMGRNSFAPSAPTLVGDSSSSSSHRSSPQARPRLHDPFSTEQWLYQPSVLDHHDVIVAREGWSYFKCNPTSTRSACPKTARIYLEGLERTLKNRDAWQQRDLLPETGKTSTNRYSIAIEPFTSFTRDKLLAITQSFLYKAAEQTAAPMENTAFIILPPPEILEHFLAAYVGHIEPYYTFVTAGLLNANELMHVGNVRAASLLILLMVALGASTTPTVEARYLTSGLTEACRISLYDTIEKDIELVENLKILRCGLLFTVAAIWSGDKQQTDIGMGQRGMYITMLDHAGLLDFQDTRLQMSDCQSNPEMAWNRWKADEERSRLVASWVLLDQECSLFMDVAPILSISSLMTVMPDMDVLWRAKTSSEWLEAYERANGVSYKPRMTLCDLFRFFLDGGLGNPNVQLSPIQLRLLLHPIQSLTIHLRQFQRCFPEGNSNRKGSHTIDKSALRSRFEEVQSLLKQWYALARRYPGNCADDCAATCANLINYHLISLNTIISLPEIEIFASSEAASDSARPSSWLQSSCTEHVEEILFHCGQTLRLLRSIPENTRPPWWPAAVYRTALATWMTSMANAKTRNLLSSLSREANKPLALDALAPEHPSIMRFLNSGEGQPMFTKKDGMLLSLEEPHNILSYCVDMLNAEEQTTSFMEGIQSKLARLAERWQPWNCD